MRRDIALRTNLAHELVKRPDIQSLLASREPLENMFDLSFNIDSERIKLYKYLYNGNGHTGTYIVPLANSNKLHIKMEYANSMGNNHYSRYWLIHLFLSEALSVIVPGETKIIEVTSGSSGISLSMATKILGYDLTMIIPDRLPLGRTQPMLDNGAKLIKVTGYIDDCILMLQKILKESNEYFATNHSNEKSNLITSVFSRIAIEYQDEFNNPDLALLGLGNGSSVEAIASVFRSREPKPTLYAYSPSNETNELVFGLLAPSNSLKHVKPALELIDKHFYTTNLNIDLVKKSFKNDTEISNLGYSSLIAIRCAMQWAENNQNKTIFTVGYDKIDRYSG